MRSQDRTKAHVGLLASMTANYSMCAPKEPLQPSDLFPSLAYEEKVADADVVTKANEDWLNLGK